MKLKTFASLLVAGAISTTANADIIAAWDWETSSGFVLGGPIVGGESVPVGAGLPGFPNTPGNGLLTDFTNNIVSGGPVATTLQWGNPGQGSSTGEQSALGITNFDSSAASGPNNGGGMMADQIMTDGAFVTINLFTHTNNILSGGSSDSPWSTLLQAGFHLTGADQPGFGGDFIDGNLAPLALVETTNLDEAGDCPAPNPQGTACDDIFTTPVLSGILKVYEDLAEGVAYFVEFQFLELSATVLPNPDLPGFVDIYTSEGDPGISIVATQARIFTREIPVPGVAGLLGLGLIGLGLMRRRNKA